MNPQKFNRLLRNIKHDKRSLALIYTEYYPKLVFHVQRRFGKLISPDDIAQDIFSKLMQLEIHYFVKTPTAWLYTLADNRAKDILKSCHEEVALEEYLADEFSIDSTILNLDVKKALSHLDLKSQQIIYLHIWEGYSYEEISKGLNISCANIRVKASRAYKELKKYL